MNCWLDAKTCSARTGYTGLRMYIEEEKKSFDNMWTLARQFIGSPKDAVCSYQDSGW